MFDAPLPCTLELVGLSSLAAPRITAVMDIARLHNRDWLSPASFFQYTPIFRRAAAALQDTLGVSRPRHPDTGIILRHYVTHYSS